MKKIMFNDKYGLTKAVLDGRKRITRRIIADKKLNYYVSINSNFVLVPVPDSQKTNPKDENIYFGIKDKITDNYFCDTITSPLRIGEVLAVAMSYEYVFYELHCGLPDKCSTGAGWKNKMFVKAEHMPYKIRITNVGVERLQDISDEDCLKEGIEEHLKGVQYGFTSNIGYIGQYPFSTPREAFAALINKVSGRGTWERNPFVWVYEFKLFD